MFRKRFIDKLREKYQKGGMYSQPEMFTQNKVRKYHEGGMDESMGYDQEHMQLEHHTGMNAGDAPDMYGPGGDPTSGTSNVEDKYDIFPGVNVGGQWGNIRHYGLLDQVLPEGKFKDANRQVHNIARNIFNPIGGLIGKGAQWGIKGIKNYFGWRDGGIRQTGGIYNQMQQYQKGGKKGEFGSGRDAYTEEEWTNMSSADRNRALGKIGGGRPGDYKGIKVSGPKYYQKGGMYNQMRQYQGGGTRLPGGQMQPIPGSDAIEFIGQSHDQGGIMMDPQTEVEGGETMDQVNIAKKGGKRDYFFSSHLKEGGRSYADMHKDILENGGNQEEINMLAQMQEVAAGRDPKQVAKLGGIAKYKTGGQKEIYTIIGDKEYTRKEYFDAIKNRTISREQILEGGKKRTEIVNKQGQEIKRQKHHQKMLDKGFIYDETTKTYKKPPAETSTPPPPVETNKSSDVKYTSPFATKEEERAFQDWANAQGHNTKGYGWGKASQAAYDSYYDDYVTSLEPDDFEDYEDAEDVDPTIEVVADKKKGRLVGSKADQKMYDNLQRMIDDGRTLTAKQQEDYNRLVTVLGPNRMTTTQRNEFKSLYDQMQDKVARKGDVPGLAYVAGATQLAPAVYSMFHKQPAAEQVVYKPGFTKPIVSERGKASDLERVSYNAERATNAAEMRGINRFIETSGGGPANVINKMSAYARKQAGDLKITAAETRANIDISNREAQLEQAMAISNMQRSQQAAITNAQLSSADVARMTQIDQYNASARQKLKDDQEAMKYQGWGLAAQGIAGLAGDVMSYQGQERLARSIGTEGIYQRDQLRNLVKKQYPEWSDDQINSFITQFNTPA